MKCVRKFDLQDRFIEFAVNIVRLTEKFPESRAGKHIASQLIRSGTSVAANYGEAQSAESKADFIHKLKIALKELRETEVWLKIIYRSQINSDANSANALLNETDELISILFKCVETASKKRSEELF